MPTVEAEPYVFEFDPRTAVQVIIDMQRDFVDPGWYVRALESKRARRSRRVNSTRSLGKIRQELTRRA